MTQGTPWQQRLFAAERVILLEIGERCRWNQLRMSAEMGVHRNTVCRKLAEHGINPHERWQVIKRRAVRLKLDIRKHEKRAA